MTPEEINNLIKKEGDSFELDYKYIKCFGKRNFQSIWCGYIEIPKDHPCLKDDNFESESLNTHGGVNFYHKDDDGGVVVGFDCSHSGDYIPNDRYGIFNRNNSIYRTKEYVIGQCENMVDQIDHLYPEYTKVLDRVFLSINED